MKKIIIMIAAIISSSLLHAAPLDERVASLEKSFNDIVQMLNTQGQKLQNIANQLRVREQAPLKQAQLPAMTGGTLEQRVLNLENTFNNTVIPMIKEQGELLNKLATGTMITQVEEGKADLPEEQDENDDYESEMEDEGY